jgi:hypothetical protein
MPKLGKAPPLPDAALLPSTAEREELIFPFDTAAFDFRALLVSMFRATFSAEELALPPPDEAGTDCVGPAVGAQPGAGPADGDEAGTLLSNLHRTALRGAALTGCYATVLGGGAGCTAGGGEALPPATAELRARFHALLLRFAREVAAPLVGCASADSVAFQRYPVLRVSFPSAKPHNPRHCDAQYHHQAGELNFWLPLTAVWGGNTLHTESAPGRADFHPLELGWGRCARFWGNRARHKCLPNDSGFTRVSLDFRALPVRRFDAGFVDSTGSPTFLRLGEYYRLGGESESEGSEEARVRATAAMAAAAAASGGGVWARR